MATKWGLLTAGNISHDFASVLRSLPSSDHQIVAVIDHMYPEKAKKFAELHNIPKVYNSYEDFMKDENIDIVHCSVLNREHYKMGKLLLKNRKNVLIEKPMCINAKQTQELISLAKKNNVFLLEGIWSRFFPVMKLLREEISKKSIGDIVYCTLTHGLPMKNVPRIREKNLGGGGILDLGVYAADALLLVFSEEPLDIKSVGALNENGIDECLSSSLLFSNNKIANIALSVNYELPNTFEIVGTKGTIKVSGKAYNCPTEIRTPDGTLSFPLPDTVLPCNFRNSSGLRYEANAVRDCLKIGLKECPEVPHKLSLMNAHIRDKWRKQIGLVFPEDEI